MARKTDGPWFREAKNCWYATVDGQKVSLRVKGREHEADALRAWHRLMAGEPPQKAAEGHQKPIKAARPLPSKETPPTDTPTVQTVVDGFLADAEGRMKPHTVEVYRWFLTLFSDAFGKRSANSVKPFEVEAFSRRPSWGPTTRADFLGTVGAAFKWAARAGMIYSDPLIGLRKPVRANRGSEAVISSDDYRRLCDAATPQFRRFLTALWLTGCRPGEVSGMTAGMVDLETAIVILTDHKTADKTGKPRLVVLSPEAVALFREQMAENPEGPLFLNRCGKRWTGWAVVKAMEAAREKAGLPKAVAYGFRHAFATDALARGVPDATVAALLGHSGTGMLHRHYSHLTSRTAVLREAAKLVRG